ncbi:hypothetical protein M885DRAFT_552996 [Pelagophyceae sp. CCMP2097]|nr:hypothetical protein M885DRAFT_552996 [Pelagophyceae sp. CCMP2097]
MAAFSGVGPWGAVALFDFSGNDLELAFKAGDALTVVHRETANWWRAEDAGGKSGMIPANYVAERPRGAAPEEPPRPALQRGSSGRKLSLSCGGVLGARLVARVSPAAAAADTAQFSVHVHGAEDAAAWPTTTKGLAELTAFDSELRRVVDDDGARALASTPELTASFVAGAISDEDAGRLQRWLQALVDAPELRPLTVAFAGRAVTGGCTVAAGGARVSASRRFSVLWDFAPSSDSELALLAGTVIFVDAFSEAADGWLFGRSEHTQGFGYFPATYVEECVEERGEAQPGAGAPAPAPAAVATRASRPHSVRSLDAFDALSKELLAVEATFSAAAGARARDGDVVRLRVSAFAWDGGAAESTPFASTAWGGGDLVLKLGDAVATDGLEKACVGLCAGDRVTATVAAPLAYGAAGYPPDVKPGAFVVYDIELVAIDAGAVCPVGPPALRSRPPRGHAAAGEPLGRVAVQRDHVLLAPVAEA